MNQKNEDIQLTSIDNNAITCEKFHGMIEFIGKRWMGIIVYHLLSGPKRYHELLSEIDGISDRLLIERLKELESHGLVIKKVSKEHLRKVEYELTEIGQDLEDIIESIIIWGKKNGCLTKK